MSERSDAPACLAERTGEQNYHQTSGIVVNAGLVTSKSGPVILALLRLKTGVVPAGMSETMRHRSG